MYELYTDSALGVFSLRTKQIPVPQWHAGQWIWMFINNDNKCVGLFNFPYPPNSYGGCWQQVFSRSWFITYIVASHLAPKSPHCNYQVQDHHMPLTWCLSCDNKNNDNPGNDVGKIINDEDWHSLIKRRDSAVLKCPGKIICRFRHTKSALQRQYSRSLQCFAGSLSNRLTYMCAHHIPCVGYEGPQSQEKLACSFLMKLGWHCPCCTSGGHSGGTLYG